MPDLSNTVQIMTAALLMAVLALPPGILSLRVLRVLRWRDALLYPIGLITGLLIVPLVWYLGATLSGGDITPGTRIVVWLVFVAGLLLLEFTLPESPDSDASPPLRDTVLLCVMGLTAALIVYAPLVRHGALVDERANGRYRTSMHDWTKHVAIGAALANSASMPPPSPFLSNDPAVRYHYFAYILPATASTISGSITIANTLIAQAVFIAFAMPFVLYGCGRVSGLPPNAALIAAFLVALVSGLDSLYALAFQLRTGLVYAHIDGWVSHAARRINGIPDMYLWTPQHVLGIQAFVIVLWIIATLQNQPRTLHLLRVIGLSGVLAALSGTSSLVWVALLVGLGLFALLDGWYCLRHQQATTVPAIVTAVIASLLLSAPHLLHMLNTTRSDAPLVFKISAVQPGIFYGGIFTQIFGRSPVTYTLDFPFQMIPEFGVVLFTGLAGWWALRHEWRKSTTLRLWTVMLPLCFFFVLAVREGRGDVNNYAPRVAPMAMILLGLLSGFWWMHRAESRWWRVKPLRYVLAMMLFLGMMTAFYEPYAQLSIPRFISGDSYALYDWLNSNLARDEVYQFSPQDPASDETIEPMYFVERRMGFAEPLLSDAFTGELSRWTTAQDAVKLGYGVPDSGTASEAFRSIAVDYVVGAPDFPLRSATDSTFEAYFSKVYENDTYTVYQVLGQ